MVVARYSHGQLVIIDRLREMVRLAAGVEENGRIDKDAAARALACLERFGQRLRDMHADSVRVVGTNTLRLARRKQAFLERAREALGHPIEIISGMEEARLIYSGVAHTMPTRPGKRLVVDIGGGSTELIIGEGLTPLELESLQMGCVAFSERFFSDGKISAKRWSARAWPHGWSSSRCRRRSAAAAGTCAGSSGTVRAIGEAIQRLGSAGGDHQARGTRARDRLLRRRGTHARAASCSPSPRIAAPVFPGGACDPRGSLRGADMEEMRVAEGAMREGLLYDMVGRFTDEDARERTVRAMQQRYHVDTRRPSASRRRHAISGSRRATTWKLEDPLAHLALKWAARLHEIGLDVSHSGYHRHGAYLMENADMPGFPARGAAPARALGRRAPPQIHARPRRGARTALGPQRRLSDRAAAAGGAAASRPQHDRAAPLELTATPRSLEVRFPARWLNEHPLTLADL